LSPSVLWPDRTATTLTSATVALTGGTFANDGDVLAFSTAGTSITASYNSSTETLLLTGADTLAHYQQVLQSVTFDDPTSDNPTDFGSNPTRTVNWTVNDGTSSFTATSTLSLTGVNDPPTPTAPPPTPHFTHQP